MEGPGWQGHSWGVWKAGFTSRATALLPRCCTATENSTLPFTIWEAQCLWTPIQTLGPVHGARQGVYIYIHIYTLSYKCLKAIVIHNIFLYPDNSRGGSCHACLPGWMGDKALYGRGGGIFWRGVEVCHQESSFIPLYGCLSFPQDIMGYPSLMGVDIIY